MKYITIGLWCFLMSGCFMMPYMTYAQPPKEIRSTKGDGNTQKDSYECAKEAQLPSLAGNTPGPTIATAAYEGGKGQYTGCMLARGYVVIW